MHLTKAMNFLDAVSDEYISVEHHHNEKKAEKKFRFEIQNCIEVIVEGTNVERARIQLIDNLRDYADSMVDGSAYVSNGVEEK